MYATAPIKRMSILERRPGDERAFYSRHWREIHGGMVSRMPFLYAYIQNHVMEELTPGRADFPADGIVEQLWRNTREMQRGYNSEVVAELIADEVNYLGHGSNYAILAQQKLREAPAGNKLVVALRHGGKVDLADALANKAAGLCPDLLRDDVIATIAKPNFLPVPPRPVDMFLHLYCADADAAAQIGRELAAGPLPEKAALGIWRVVTATIVAPAQ